MEGNSTTPRKAQLDKEEREHLEDVVTEMRERIEANVRYQLEEYDLEEEPDEDASLSDDEEDLVEAIELEAVDGNDWEEGYEQYITSVGYTIVNRLAALRCMEVRDFIDDEVTRFREDGLTPAADRLVTEKFMLEEEAVLEAYWNACDDLAEEIEILFDRSTAYSLIDPDDDTFEDLCGMLDEVSDGVWKADDVLGWVYEYYNSEEMEDLRRKGDYEGLRPMDVPPANQFYTPHWVVRMLTDNSLGRLYLEHKGNVDDVVSHQSDMSLEDRKQRQESSNGFEDFCTYLVPTAEEGRPPDFENPEDIKVIDPACGSGHFLLYAFDLLEHIWQEERPSLDDAQIPQKILRHNLYGIDLDMRACQLAAFNLYLKARRRAESEGSQEFDLPEIGIVCADAKIADVSGAEDVFEEVADGRSNVQDALSSILDAFEDIHGLGSLLDVRGTLEDVIDEKGGQQLTFEDDFSVDHSLSGFLHSLREVTSEHRDEDSFLAQDLRSFVRLLDLLAQDYDVALMNPPYGSGNRMPDEVQDYVRDHYNYKPEFYINFFEVCEKLVKDRGRIGMIVPRTFMFKRTFQDFRKDFIGDRGSFDFLSEYGIGVLDKATVRTAGTVVRVNQEQKSIADFYRLHDLEKGEKERAFLEAAFTNEDRDIQRHYRREVSVFSRIPGTPLSYWVGDKIREIYNTDTFYDAENADLDSNSLGQVKQGLGTANNDRFLRYFWEESDEENWAPFAKGGSDAWILPRVTRKVLWENEGAEIKRYHGSRVQNVQHYFTEGLTYTNIKEGGKRFGYLHPQSIFGIAGQAFLPNKDIWEVLAYSNSNLVTYLVLALTTGRHWQVGEVSRIPWDTSLGDQQDLSNASQKILGLLLGLRKYDFISPYYENPLLIDIIGGETEPLYADPHPHRDLLSKIDVPSPDELDKSHSLEQMGIAAGKYREQIREQMQAEANQIESILFDHFDLDSEEQEDIYREIALRTNENPLESTTYDPSSIIEPPEDFDKLVKDLLLHVVVKIVTESDDGIVPVKFDSDDGQDLLALIEEEFENIFGEHGRERLSEVDQVLGNIRPEEESYPNVQDWLHDGLFDYHISRFETTPILWKITSRNLIPDPTGEGFSCLIDYHQLNPTTFDSISNQYLELQKSALRQKLESADKRRTDESLSSTERSKATDQYERCSSGLEQLAEFEEVIQDLLQPNPRDWGEEQQILAAEFKSKVSEFRERTQDRLRLLDNLADREDVNMEELFTSTFYPTVQQERKEWISTLNALEEACEAYSKDASEPVNSKYYDLFPYFDSLVGSTHFASNGILFMTYYFENGEDYLENGEPRDGLSQDIEILAKLAMDLDDYISLANEINDKCSEIAREIPSSWEERAYSEITTPGYQPNRKHGVIMNIRPLAENNLVPEVVDEKIL